MDAKQRRKQQRETEKYKQDFDNFIDALEKLPEQLNKFAAGLSNIKLPPLPSAPRRPEDGFYRGEPPIES